MIIRFYYLNLMIQISELKKKYYKLAKEYHPDTLVSKGLPDEFLKFANERLSSINEVL